MKTQATPSQDREYKVYISNTHQFVPVAKEFYYEHYRPIWRIQKEAQKHGQCMFPKSKLKGAGTVTTYRSHHIFANGRAPPLLTF